jgi:hypothetical protein
MSEQLSKFGVNRYGVVNAAGQQVSEEYLRRYIHCWCRVSNGFTHNRAANIAYFMSDEFLSQHTGKTASQIGKAASLSPLWKPEPKPVNPRKANSRTRARK